MTPRARVQHVFSLIAIPMLVACAALPALGQEKPVGTSPDGIWTALDTEQAQTADLHKAHQSVRRFSVFQMDNARLELVLGRAPLDRATRALSALTVPLPDGTFSGIGVAEDALLSPEMQAAYPHIKTYSGRGIDDPTATVVLDQTDLGFHAQVIGQRGTLLIDPVDADAGLYMSYWKSDAVGAPFRCLVDGSDSDPLHAIRMGRPGGISPLNPSGTSRRTYSLRIVTTHEYTNWAGSRDTAVSRATTTINRVRGIYEREVSVSFTLASVDALLSSDTGYPFAVPAEINGPMLTQNDTWLDDTYGSGNYEIGHVLGQGGGGGLAGLGVVCTDSKGRGGTSRANPQGDAFDVDYVAHEMGHQMGGDHTFNGVNGSCAGGNREASSAYEPGSGTTIMAYAGICGPDDIQPNSDDYFHTRSFDQITARRDAAGCGTLTDPTGNTPPNVNAGADHTIPQNTPFMLTGSGSDPDGQPITFNWEQYDLGDARSRPISTDTSGPLFRSRPSSSSASRTLPRLDDILSGAVTTWEVLPTVDRTMHFRVTARDNAGGVRWDDMVVNVSGSRFRVTAPAGGETECGVATNLAWDVGGGSAAPTVRVDFSSDNGSSFATLVPSTANDGAEPVMFPKLVGANRRIRLWGNDNIFFSISGPFSIADRTPPSITAPVNIAAECTQKSPQGATPAIGSASATDACDTTLTITNNAPPVFPLGTTVVTWTATDDSLNTATAGQGVTVVDTTPPTIVAPPAIVAECTSPLGTPVALGTAGANDVCWATLNVSNDAPALFPLGTTIVTWTATDGSTNSSSATQPVKIQDTTPPTLGFSLTPALIWPANHKLVRIVASVNATDVCDAAPAVRLVSITSSEPENGLGDGDTPNDIQGATFGSDDREFFLRAERSGLGPGRTYAVTYSATDASGNRTVRQASVFVPHDVQ